MRISFLENKNAKELLGLAKNILLIVITVSIITGWISIFSLISYQFTADTNIAYLIGMNLHTIINIISSIAFEFVFLIMIIYFLKKEK